MVEVLVEGPSARKRSNTTLGEAGTVSEDGEVAPLHEVQGEQPVEEQRWGGRTRTNKMVFFDAAHEPTGTLVKVLVDSSTPWFLEGQLLTAAPMRSRRLAVLA